MKISSPAKSYDLKVSIFAGCSIFFGRGSQLQLFCLLNLGSNTEFKSLRIDSIAHSGCIIAIDYCTD